MKRNFFFLCFVISALLGSHLVTASVNYQNRFATVAQCGDSKQTAAIDKDNNVILFGIVACIIDLSPNTTYITEWGQGYLAKYDNTPEHNLIWYKTIVSDFQNYYMQVLPNGDIVVAVTYWSFALLNNEACGGPSDADVFIARYSGVDGSEMWHKCYIANGAEYVQSISVSHDNYIYTTGWLHSYGTINFGGDTLGGGWERGSWVAKLDLNGNHVWSTSFQGLDLFAPFDSKNNALTVAGAYIYGDYGLPYGGSIIQLAADTGATNWRREVTPSDQTSLLDVDMLSDGSSVVVGYSVGPFAIDGVSANATGTMIFAKFDINGNLVWIRSFGDQNSLGADRPLSHVRVGRNNVIYITGKVCGDSLCSLSVGGDTIPANSGFIAAFDSNGQFLWQNYFNALSGGVYDALVYTTPSIDQVAFVGLPEAQVAIDNVVENRGTFVHLYDASSILTSGDVCSPCSSNYDCGNGRGVCISSAIGSYCSCFSGFGGCDCSRGPAASCSSNFSEVDALSGNFQADASIDYNYPSLLVTVTANLEESMLTNGVLNTPPYSTETIIFFGSDPTAYPACSYPNGGLTWTDLAATDGQCSDKYVANMNWTFALASCGFAASVSDNRLYSQTVTIQRKYNLDGVLFRTEQTTRSLSVKFPSDISVTTSDVTVLFPSAAASAAITKIDYQPSNLLWTVKIQTSISAPYFLGAPSSSSLSGNLAQRNPSVTVSPCTDTNGFCVQTVTYTFGQGSLSDACLALSGSDQSSFPVLCSTATCPNPADFVVTLRLNTGSACPATDLITFSEASLASYQDASLSTPYQAFTINDQAYFGASVQTNDALISSRSIKPNTLCFQPSSGVCFYPTYSLLPATAGKDPVFVVDFQDPVNAAYFSAVTEPTQFFVNAVIQVNFAGAKGLLKNVPQSQSVQAISQAMIMPASESATSSSALAAPLLSLCALLALLVL